MGGGDLSLPPMSPTAVPKAGHRGAGREATLTGSHGRQG